MKFGKRLMAAGPAWIAHLPVMAADPGLLLPADSARIASTPHEALIAGSVLLSLIGLLAIAPAAGATAASWIGRQRRNPHDSPASTPDQDEPDNSLEATPSTESSKPARPSPSESADAAQRRDLATRLQQVRKADTPGSHSHAAMIAEAHLQFGRLRTADELICKLEYELTRPRTPSTPITSLPGLGRSSVLLARDEVVKDEAPEAELRPKRIGEHAARGHASDWLPGEATLELPSEGEFRES